MSIAEQFDRVSKDYDAQRRKLLPCFEDFYKLPIQMLDYEGDAPRVLDIGSGTGLFADCLLEKYPNAKLTLIDVSEEMLHIAKQRFQNNPNVTCIVADYTTYDFSKPFDIIISALSIHHLNAAQKQALYKRCYASLCDGGVFVNADQVLSEFAEIEEKFFAEWRQFVENSGLSREEIEKGYERIRFDNPSTLAEQLEWLRDAGFCHYDILYKYYHFCVFYAKR